MKQSGFPYMLLCVCSIPTTEQTKEISQPINKVPLMICANLYQYICPYPGFFSTDCAVTRKDHFLYSEILQKDESVIPFPTFLSMNLLLQYLYSLHSPILLTIQFSQITLLLVTNDQRPGASSSMHTLPPKAGREAMSPRYLPILVLETFPESSTPAAYGRSR